MKDSYFYIFTHLYFCISVYLYICTSIYEINNVFKEKELEEKSNVQFLHIANSDATVKDSLTAQDGRISGELPTPKGMSFGENSPLFFPASFCHCFLGHEVVHPQEGSPQA